jgi:hypothetical protein
MFSVSRLFGKSRPAGPVEPGFDAFDVAPPAQRIPVRATASQGDHPAPDKSDRAIQRDALYSAVREAMVGAGVLSSRYKFKVLSVNREATEFVVMIDLAEPLAGGPEQHNWIEGLIARMARTRQHLTVKAVYWRVADQAGYVAPRPPTSTALRSVLPHRSPAQPVTGLPVAATPVVPTRLNTQPLTGYEDTEQGSPPAGTERALPGLSPTQYGDLH